MQLQYINLIHFFDSFDMNQKIVIKIVKTYNI
jgi:hypothetical protein